ncbi:carboxypeptidase-like regulatory domain-containing protein [Cyclobacterium qasimii]|uniref:TonB-dependent receptor n=1 Tax=Cyclobacterium qasimii M12-11B TaxID=641524 RepID=S7WEF9_9BACT|nr:carboxypeptidase-like regulatory domain-containing protein [Cyclobacterium qasimii]EPR65164.1 TonB-dependent receptor [Cyclobacterium qasimii M12-11B]
MKTLIKSFVFVMVLCFSMGHYKLLAQSGNRLVVKGTVSSAEDGATIPGVAVLEKGTSNGTVTDIDGAYEITLSNGNAVLVFLMLALPRRSFR